MIPIVIPLHHCGGKLHDDSELRFALRSLEKHFKTDFEVVIIGRKLPAWLHGVKHIEQPRKGLKTALHMAAKSYPDGFFWLYDDTILVRDTAAEEMKVTPACRSWSKPKTAWRKQLDSIRVRLQAEQLPAWDYSSPHGPYWLDKGMVDESFRDWPGMASKFPFESWILSKRDWPRRHGVVKQYYGAFNSPPGESQSFINFNNKGFTIELRDWLRARFPEPSRFEKVWPVAKLNDVPDGQRLAASVIYLPSRPRWESQCVADMAEVGIDVALFAGFDGHAGTAPVMQVNRAAFQKEFMREPLPGEIGCFASHIQFARAFDITPPVSAEFPDWRLVFEDDAVSVGMDAVTLRKTVVMAEHHGFDVVILNTGRENRRGFGDFNVTQTNRKDVFTHAVLLNGRAAREMSGWLMRHPIDLAISKSNKLNVGVLWGAARFNQRPPSTSDHSIQKERLASKAGLSLDLSATRGLAPDSMQSVHQIWIGGNPQPARLAAYCETMRQAFPGWTYRLWTEEDMPGLASGAVMPEVVLGMGHWGESGLSMGVRSDVVRLEILRQFGGIYFDTDFEALRKDLRPLFEGIRGFAYSDQRAGHPGIGILAASSSGNAFVELYLRRIAASLAKPERTSDVLTISGPERIRECLNYWMGRWDGGAMILQEGQRIRVDFPHAGISAFFAEIMHPYWYGTATWATFDPAKHPAAWAAHHWEAGWKK